jgi:hypothetical protein
MEIDVTGVIVIHHLEVANQGFIPQVNLSEEFSIGWTQRIVHNFLRDQDVEVYKATLCRSLQKYIPDYWLLP